MIPFELHTAVTHLLADAVQLLDSDELETWVDCFEETARYRVLSRENVVRNMPLPLFQCDSKGALRDRVLSLRKANVVNPHRDCHVASLPRITIDGDGRTLLSQSTYALYQTSNEGVSRLFSVGTYQDRIQVAGDRARFLDRTVIVDMFSVPTMLSTPI